MDGTVVDVAPLVSKISEQGPLAAFMLLVIIGLAWLVIYLIKKGDAQNQVITNALINNTAVISEFKEMVRASLHK